ncbi:MAG: hypothetical protein IT203_05650 [Fimbriimonadaceae bacterium]|nr:hypothetical protein [Fimbriimonadaceae bacterium]
MLTSLLLGCSLLAPPKFSFYESGPYDASVPRPEKILGYELGEKHTVYRDQERVVLGIAEAAKAKVVPMEYGKSAEGRTLRLFAISSAENIKNLEQIRKDHATLANPTAGQDLSALARRTPAIVWINECIHGDETASFESGMALLYNLAASRGTRIADMLQDVVVLLNPVYNPDGHERYVVAYNSIPNGSPEAGSYDNSIPSAFFGRANHYRFDMNRDRIAMSQAETRQEVAMYLRWNPQVYVDQHGQVENYFMPPTQQSLNVNVDRERYKKWTEVFGRATGKAFDDKGWSYYIRDQFDFYNACYLDTHSTLMGAIGMTQETDGGRNLNRYRQDETLLTMRDGAAKHFTAALAVIEAAAKSKAALMESYLSYKTAAVTGKHAGKFQRVVLTSEDPRELRRFQEHLARTGIQSYFAAKDWDQADTHDYWSDKVGKQEFPKGALIVDMAQPMGQLAKAWLEPGSDFEPDFVARQKEKAKVDKEGKGDAEIDSYEFYDSTAWCHVYGYNLRGWWCESAPEVPSMLIAGEPSSRSLPSKSPVGYYMRYTDQEDILFVARALQAGLKVQMNQHPLKLIGGNIPRGSFMFLAQRNEDGFEKKLFEMASQAAITLEPLTSGYPEEGRYGPGSEGIIHLRKPTIGIVMGNTGNLADVGPMWYLMEKVFKLPFTPLSSQGLNGSLDRYTCIVVPGGGGASTSGKLGEWVRAGGCVVALDNPSWAIGSGAFVSLESASGEPDLPGAIFRAELNPKSFLGFGYPAPEKGPIPFAVPIDGSSFYKSPKSGSVIQIADDSKTKKLLSGWSWDDTEKSVAGTAWLHDAPVGRGRAVIFTHNPTERAQWPGLFKLLLNAMIIGPSA